MPTEPNSSSGRNYHAKTPLKAGEIPLRQLWCDSEWIEAERQRYLTCEEAARLIGDQAIAIGVASITEPLRWPDRDQRFNDWKALKTLLIDGTASIWATSHAEFYVASLWRAESRQFILFEYYH
jgi:hypothetical protein